MRGQTTRNVRPLLVLSLALMASTAWANRGGAPGYSGLQGANQTCSLCHGGGGANVTITGPTTVTGGQTANYTFNVGGGTAGVAIAVDSKYATLQANNANTSIVFGEVVHGPNPVTGGAVNFRLVTPTFGGTIRIFAAGIRANGDGGTGGDQVVVANLTVNVQGAPGAPLVESVTTPAREIFSDSAQLNVVALDDGGEPALTYTWEKATGPGTVTFTPNGSNGGKAAMAKFSAAGDYTLNVVVKDGANSQTQGKVDVKVSPAPTSMVITPQTVGVPTRGSLQFKATLLDQFKTAVPTQPAFTWEAPLGGGTVTESGLFTADNFPTTGPIPVTATYNGMRATASVTIASGAAPSFSQRPTATINELTAQLRALATDDGGEAALKYTWSMVSGPGTVTFSANDTNAAKNSTATFSTAGTYQLSLTVKDAAGLTVSNTLTLPVTGAPGAIVTNPDVPGTGGGGSVAGRPVVLWRTPTAGGTVSGKIDVEVEATDDTGVKSVDFFIGDRSVASATGSPWKAVIDTCRLADGPHNLIAMATDRDNNEALSTALSLNVANNGACASGTAGGGSASGGCSAAGGLSTLLPLLGAALAGLVLRRKRRG